MRGTGVGVVASVDQDLDVNWATGIKGDEMQWYPTELAFDEELGYVVSGWRRNPDDEAPTLEADFIWTNRYEPEAFEPGGVVE